MTNKRKWSLTTDQMHQIRFAAERVLDGIKCARPHVSMRQAADYLGASIRRAPYNGGELAGMLIRTNGRSVIAVNSNHHKNRQRFTIAHECGHLILHQGVDTHVDEKVSIWRRNERSATAEDLWEVEANHFAAELLMPLRFLAEDQRVLNADLEDEILLRELAKEYKVSQQAMSYRLLNVATDL